MSSSRVKTIRTEQDYANALARIDEFMDKNRSPDEDDEFKDLTTLVEAYENWNLSVNDPDPIEATESA